jgi:hypothetical protein
MTKGGWLMFWHSLTEGRWADAAGTRRYLTETR